MPPINKEAAQKVCNFFPDVLRHSKGAIAGEPFTLLPWQTAVLSELFGRLNPDGSRLRRVGYIEVPKKNGKMLDLNTPILTCDGWKTIGSLSVGDFVFHPDGHPVPVLAKSEVMDHERCFRLSFAQTTETIVAGENHLWETSYLQSRGTKQETKVRTTLDIFRTAKWKHGNNHSVRLNRPLQFPARPLPIDPYVMGVWLGDGHSSSARITVGMKDGEETIANISKLVDVSVKKYKSSNAYIVLLKNGTQAKLRKEGLLDNKHVPDAYKFASVEQRRSLVQGLLDTDGTISKAGQAELTLCNQRLAEDALLVIRSLGHKASMKASDATIDGKVVGTRFRIQFTPLLPEIVFRLSRKQERVKGDNQTRRQFRSKSRHITGLVEVPKTACQCIQVGSKDGMFLCGESLIPTHNSTLLAGVALYLLVADAEPGAEIYGAAADREQASIIYREAAAMVRASPSLSRHCEVIDSRKTILVRSTNSFYRVLSADAFRSEGLNIHGLLFDELHAQRDRRLWRCAPRASARGAQRYKLRCPSLRRSSPKTAAHPLDHHRRIRPQVDLLGAAPVRGAGDR